MPTNDNIAEVKRQTDLVALVSQTVQLTKESSNRYKGYCPFHADKGTKNMGLSVYLDPKDNEWKWHCFGSCIGKTTGDCIDWVRKRDNCTLPAALVILSGSNGHSDQPIPPRSEPPPPIPADLQREHPDFRLRMSVMQTKLLLNQKARDYLASRLIDEFDIERYGLGYSDEDDALAIPHENAERQIVAIKYRSLKKNVEKRYSCAVGSDLSVIYNVNALHELGDGTAYVTEGEFDCQLWAKSGNVVVSLPGGANSFKLEHVQLFQKYKTVYLLLDADEGGRAGMDKIASMIGDRAVPVSLPEGMDVTDFFLAKKAEGKTLDDTVEELDHLVKAAKKAADKALRLKRGELLGAVEVDGFLRAYIEYAYEQTDAPRELHLAAGLAILAAACGNRIFFEEWGGKKYLNLWTVLIAPSGVCHKTTCMNIALDILKAADENLLLANKYTSEALNAELEAHPSGVMPIWEFASLIESFNRDYNATLKEDLTAYYDGSPTKRKTLKATSSAVDIALSIMSATVIDWLRGKIKPEDLRGGFFSRFLFIPAVHHDEDWRGVGTHRDYDMRRELIDFLTGITQREGKIDTSLVNSKINTWLKSHDNRINKEGNTDLVGLYSRAGSNVLKLAAIYEMSSTRNFTISERSVDNAIATVEFLERSTEAIVTGGLFESRTRQCSSRIVSFLNKSENLTASQGEIVHALHLDAKEAEAAIKTLLIEEFVETKTVKAAGIGRGRPRIMVTLSKPTVGA